MAANPGGPQEIKLFGKWSYDDVEVSLTSSWMLVNMYSRSSTRIASVGERHFAGGLHCCQIKECCLRASHSWTLSKEEVQESTVPNR